MASDIETLTSCFRAGVSAALPGPAVERALEGEGTPAGAPVVIAAGKAAGAMAEAAVRVLAARDLAPAGGMVVAPDDIGFRALPVLVAEHPVPGPGSRRAAEALARLARETAPGSRVWMLLSGGATSLLGGPDEGVDPAELEAAWHLLLTSGLDITAMNGVRKRLTRWGGGKLALALAHTRVLQLIVSDVIGNDLPSIGSGPLVADPVDAATVTTSLRATAVWSSLPPGIRRRLEHLASGALPDTPRPGNPCFAHVETRVIVSNEAAVRAAADAGRARGWDVEVDPRPLAGESRLAGERIARWLLEPGGPRPRLRVQGGEPTVTIPPGSTGKGGRAQELALAAAAVLAAAEGPSPFLLAAGTDGRDGPTDAAGAVVDAGTWRRVAEAGVNPAEALARHDAWTALDAAGALLRTGPTGTNVMDLVLALRPAALKA